MRCLLFLSLLTSLLGAAPHPHQKSILEAGKRIDSVTSGVHGTFAIAFKDLRTGTTLYRNAGRSFVAASTIKTAVMIEVYRQARRGRLSLRDSLPVVNRFTSIVDRSPFSLDRTADTDDSLYARIGQKEEVGKLVVEMITLSSNLAADLLTDRVRPAAIRRTMSGLGLKEIRVLRGVEDMKAYEAGRNNTVTARALARLFELLAEKKVIGKRESNAMLGILESQRLNDMIPALLPRTVRIAHKTGSSAGVEHDGGIILLPDGREYVLVVLSSGLADPRSGKDAIAAISRILYDYEVAE
ncbi:MAG TPA: serine hydrolase [Bacteroidota bacterium]|nr:serine hydrolase [Bacteroidota bacterium]